VIEKGIALGRTLNQQPMVHFLSRAALLNLYHAGRWQEALSQIDAHLAESAAGTPHYLDSQSLYLRSRMRLARGDVAGALEDAEGSLERARRAKDPQNLFPATASAAVVFCSTGQRERAEPLVEELLRALVGEATGMWSFVDLGWALLSLGREPELLPVLAVQNPSRWVDAAAAVARGDLEAAAETFTSIGSRVAEATARLRAAERLVAEGRRAEAAPHLDAALAFFASVGASASTREAEALLAASA
jgi:tetratricopeptide (TPR) repeat protein